MDRNIQTIAAHWLKLLICSLVLLNTQVHGSGFSNITILESAVAKGAVCLDGSPPAYSFLPGSGEGANNWLLFIDGGGWCDSVSDCLERSKGFLGSSRLLRNRIFDSGLLDQEGTFNPDFYNWNMVRLVYCDGASFMGDVEEIDPNTNLTFRGARIFNAIVEEMLAKGMENATNAMLTGSSAGGLAAILHCDMFRAFLPNTTRVKCVSDSGFFLHAKQLPGAEMRADYFSRIVELHGLAKTLPTSCTSKMNPDLCLFPEYLVGDIQTPLFLVESAFDSYQIGANLVPAVGGVEQWSDCTGNLTLCTPTQLQIMKDFRDTFIGTLQQLDNSSSRGMFVHSCYRHVHFIQRRTWWCSSVIGNVLANKTIAKAIGDWYFDRSPFQVIDIQNDLPRNCTTTLDDDGINSLCLKQNG